MILSLQQQLVGLAIPGRSLGQAPLIFWRQSQTKAFGNLTSKLLLHLEDILKFPVELTAPELRVVHHIHQFRLYDKSVATLNQLTSENGTHV